MNKKTTPIYQIKVTLKGSRPPIWRRILVTANTNLFELHKILQIVMGWEDYHLHMFTISGSRFGDPLDDEYGDLGTQDEAGCKLSQVIYRAGQRFGYEYDFGDSWDHTLLVEKILPYEEGLRYPLCLKGKRASPPEDVGGVWGYQYFLEAIQDPYHSKHDSYLEWAGEGFDPEAFDLDAINGRLRQMGRGRGWVAISAWDYGEGEPEPDLAAPPSGWMQTLTDDQQIVAVELPLRRDMITLLTYLRDNKVTGTQSTGNLPLKAVNEICARFVVPPRLEDTIGEHIYRVRTETDVWPLYFRHVLASVGGLVKGGLGRRWTLTQAGERYLAAPAPLQVWFLSVTWWTQINWAIATRFGFEGGYMPAGFSHLALNHLLDLPVGGATPYDPFADRMIDDAGLTWPGPDQDISRVIRRGIIERTVIDPAVAFGILQVEYVPHKLLGIEFPDLSTIRLTPFGEGLLEEIEEEDY